MKKLFLIMFVMTSSLGFCQEGVNVEGNTVTAKQIGPVWPGCEGTVAEISDCFNKKLSKHVVENYQYVKDAEGNYIRGKAVVSFNINKEGEVEILSVEGPKEELNAEAKRIILTIPKMKPGQLAGKPVAIKYTVPFTF